MMRAAFMALFLLAGLCGGTPGNAEEPQPYHLVRALEMLQNDIARGSTGAHAGQARLVAEIAAQFAKTDLSLWRDRRNAQAAAIFLFSGGRAASLRAIAAAKGFAVQDAGLVAGAIAYAEGRENDARRLLAPIDPMLASGSLGGQLALVQSTLLRNSDVKRAMDLLDVARLLSPGTLVEEAALRRQIMLAEADGALPRFTRLGSQYLRRFRSSIYAANMITRMKPAIVDLVLKDDGGSFEAANGFIASFSGEERVEMNLAIAQRALITGKLNLLRRSASDVADLIDKSDAVGRSRAGLYRAAAASLSGSGSSADELAAMDFTPLDERDRQLGQATAQVARWVAAWPQRRSADDMRQRPDLDPKSPAMLLVTRAEQSLASASRLLEGAK